MVQNGQGQQVKDEASVIVSKAPADIHLEVDGQIKTQEIIKFSENKSRKVNSKVLKASYFYWFSSQCLERHSNK